MSQEEFIRLMISQGMSEQEALRAWNDKVLNEQGSAGYPSWARKEETLPGGTFQVPLSMYQYSNPQESLLRMQQHDFANEATPYRQVAQWQAEQDSVSSSNRRAIEAALASLLRPIPASATETWEFGGKSGTQNTEPTIRTSGGFLWSDPAGQGGATGKRTFEVPSTDAGMIPESRWSQIQQLMENLKALDVLDANQQTITANEMALEEARANPDRLKKVGAKTGIELTDPSKLQIAGMRDATANRAIDSKERMAARRDAILEDAQKIGADIRIAEHRAHMAKLYRDYAAAEPDQTKRAELEARAAMLESQAEGVGNSPQPTPGPQQGSGIDEFYAAAGVVPPQR